MEFTDKTILITGVASGIGRATAELLSNRAAGRLILVDINAQALNELSLGCDAVRLAGDVANEQFWRSAEIGTIDHAVISAGIAGAGMIADLAYEEWRRILTVNLDGAFLTLRAAMRVIRDGGSIVGVASAAGMKPEPGIAPYAASKAGMIQLMRVAAKEAASRDVRVNVIAPGGVETPIWNGVPMFAERSKEIGRDAAFAEMAALDTPLKRFAKPGEIAEQIAFLLSDACRTVTGTVFVSDGGYTL